MPKSLTLRLALFFGVVSTAALIATGYFVTTAVERHFVELDRAELESKKNFVDRALARSVDAEPDASVRRFDQLLAAENDAFLRLSAADGKTLYLSPGANFPAQWPASTSGMHGSVDGDIATWETQGHHYRGIRSPVSTQVGGSPAMLSIAIDIDRHHKFMGSFYRTLWAVVALAVLTTGLLGWVAARRGLEPVRNMAHVAQNVTASHLTERLNIDTLPVELVDLAHAFNAMLSRLEDSFRRLSEFSSDLAHELRTPISNLLTQTQVALSRSRSTEEYRDVLYSNVEEFERLARMISDMLFLAKADNGLIVPATDDVDLANEVRNLFDYYDALAEEHGVKLALDGDGSMQGERLMVRRAINNLLSNAVNHSPRDSTVNVRIEKVNDEVRLSVENPGDTIPPEHLERIFDRFYRIDPARQRLSEGAGLGLAITKSIVTAHRGTVHAFSDAGVTRIELTFPTQRAATAS